MCQARTSRLRLAFQNVLWEGTMTETAGHINIHQVHKGIRLSSHRWMNDYDIWEPYVPAQFGLRVYRKVYADFLSRR